jgi:hypothetical protein
VTQTANNATKISQSAVEQSEAVGAVKQVAVSTGGNVKAIHTYE